nr:hypothetical protein GCM10020093_101930 [Planobispora longispora]
MVTVSGRPPPRGPAGTGSARAGDQLDLGAGPVELAVVAEDRVGPQAEDHLQRLVEPVTRLGQVDAEALELEALVAAPDAQLQPSAGEQVHHGRLLGDVDRVVQRQDHDPGAEAEPFGPGGQVGQHGEQVGHDPVVAEVVLGQSHPGEPQLLGEFRQLQVVVVDVLEALAVEPVEEVEGRELHRRPLAVVSVCPVPRSGYGEPYETKRSLGSVSVVGADGPGDGARRRAREWPRHRERRERVPFRG